MSTLDIENVSKFYGTMAAVDQFSLNVRAGEMVALLGPSGCGKTTTLRMIAGFVAASRGDIKVSGRSIVDLPPHKRNMGIVFQNYALFPHLTAAANIGFGLEMRGIGRAEVSRRVDEMLALVKLDGLAGRLPRQLSGGQQQRVALARALAIRPDIVLLDEPLSNLDASLRSEVARDIRILQREHGFTTIMVTHDQDEAMAMGDRLVVMKDGRIQQTGDQEDLYERPETAFVASFIGRSNLIEGHVDGQRNFAFGGEQPLLLSSDRRSGPATMALRPERLALRAGREAGKLTGTVVVGVYLGAVVEHAVQIAPDKRIVVRQASEPGNRLCLPPGSEVSIDWDGSAERVFEAS